MQAVFPTDDKYTYVVESYQSKELETFPGAPGFAFESQVRINIEEANVWLDKMQQHSHVTYRVTITKKTGQCRVLCKLEQHCQHFRKSLTENKSLRLP